jgi:DHA2 family multidrug resistance protein
VLTTFAFIGFSGIFFMRSNYLADTDFFHLALPTLLQGIPTVFWFVPLVSIILSGLPPERIAAAAGLSNFVRIFCGAAGTAIAGSIWNNRTALHHVRLSEQASIDNPLFMQSTGSTQSLLDLNSNAAHALFNAGVNSQAAVMGLDDFFYMSTFIFIAIIPLIWITRPGKSSADASSAAH